MLIIKHGYRRKYVYGGSGIFDSIGTVISKIAANSAVQKLALDAGKKALEFTGKKAVDVIESQAKNLITKFRKKKLNSNSSAILQRLSNNSLNPKNLATLQRLTNNSEVSLNNLIAGSGQTVTIQNLARRLNGSGLKQI